MGSTAKFHHSPAEWYLASSLTSLSLPQFLLPYNGIITIPTLEGPCKDQMHWAECMADAHEMFSILLSPGCLALSLQKREECAWDGVGRVGGKFKHFWDVLIMGRGQAEKRSAAPFACLMQSKLVRPRPLFEAAREGFCAPNPHAGSSVQHRLPAERLSRCLESRLSTLFWFWKRKALSVEQITFESEREEIL